MATKITISIPDELHDQIKEWAEARGGTVSGFFAELAERRLDADQTSRERLSAMIEKDRAADPEAYDKRKAELRERMHAAKEAAARKKASMGRIPAA